MKIDVHVVNAFIEGDQGGNPAGVVPEADHWNASRKQQIAAAVGLSETAFVSSSASADFKLEFFTPTRQIAHCGHATIAAFSYLHAAAVTQRDRSASNGCRWPHFRPAGRREGETHVDDYHNPVKLSRMITNRTACGGMAT